MRANRTLGKRVEARLDRHDREDQRGVELDPLSDLKRFCHQGTQRLGRHAVLAAQPKRHLGLLPGQFAGQGGGDPVDGGGLGIKGQQSGGVAVVAGGSQGFLAVHQPAQQLLLADGAPVGVEAQGDQADDQQRAKQGRAVVGDGDETLVGVVQRGAHQIGEALRLLAHLGGGWGHGLAHVRPVGLVCAQVWCAFQPPPDGLEGAARSRSCVRVYP